MTMLTVQRPGSPSILREAIDPRTGIDEAPLTAAERIALDHVEARRAQGWKLPECQDEVHALLDELRVLDPGAAVLQCEVPFRTWDELVYVLAQIWEGLRAGPGTE